MNNAVPSTQDVFASEERVLQALVTIRNSTLSTEDKAMLRNQFLDYSSADDTKKTELKKQILSQLDKFAEALPTLRPQSNAPVVTSTPETPTKPAVRGFGRGRTKPSFSVSTTITTPKPPKPTTNPSETVSTPAATPTSNPVPATPVEATVPTQPEPTPPAPETTTPQPELVVEVPKAATPEPIPAPEPVTPPPSNIDYKTRINQIKHDINSAAGNPVNLVDADEKVGREYMSSLLEAIKQSSVGGPSADEALARLEKTYQAAKEVIKNNPNIGQKASVSTPKTPPAPEPEPIATPKPAPEKLVVPELITPTPPPQPAPTPAPAADAPKATPAPLQQPVPTPKAPEPARATGLYHRPEDEVLADKREELEKASSLTAKAAGLWRKDKPGPETESPVAPITTPAYGTEPRKVAVASNATQEKSPEKTQTPVKTNTSHLRPLSDTTTLPDKISKLEAEAEAREAKKKEPISNLDDQAVTDGLKQLLSEWKLFKSSGFLGTGPSGIDHPLYKRLAKLPMASVIAGRFEGSSPEVKHGITDYMNGWRYEHGIVHDLGESFEHYLRRVIRHILERQRTSGLPKV